MQPQTLYSKLYIRLHLKFDSIQVAIAMHIFQ